MDGAMTVMKHITILVWPVRNVIINYNLYCVVNELDPSTIIYGCQSVREYPSM